MALPLNRFAIATVTVLLLATGGEANAQAPATGLSTQTSISVEAKVSAVDHTTRMMTLAMADGRTITGKVSDAVQNLGQVKAGDTAVVSYEERTSYVLSERGTRVPATGETVVSSRAARGEMPAAGLMRQTQVNYTVVATNVQTNTITLVDAGGGSVRTYDVTTAPGRAALPRVKPGDFLTVIDRQTLIGAIVRKP